MKVFIVDDSSNSSLDGFVEFGFGSMVPFIDDVFTWTSNFEEADIIPINLTSFRTGIKKTSNSLKEFLGKNKLQEKIFLEISHLNHIQEHETINCVVDTVTYLKNFLAECSKEVPVALAVHTNNQKNNKDDIHSGVAFVDFVWNRTQTLYVKQPDRLFNTGPNVQRRTTWYPKNINKEIYTLPNIDPNFTRMLIECSDDRWWLRAVLSPSKVRPSSILYGEFSGYDKMLNEELLPRDFLRVELMKLLSNYPTMIGDPASHNTLLTQDISTVRDQILNMESPGAIPIHNAYYEASCISCYVETITFGESVRSITEKTWDPLIKGHFILPFGYCGMISDLVNIYGMTMPEWIDYSYDSEGNDLVRWMKYLLEVKRVLNLGSKELMNKKIVDVDILHYNRHKFFEIGYQNTVYNAIQRLHHKKS